MKPTIGRIILVNISSDPEKPALRPAIVTAVWSDLCVNALLVPDGENDAQLLIAMGEPASHRFPTWLTSISQALAGDGSVGYRQWCWPPRV